MVTAHSQEGTFPFPEAGGPFWIGNASFHHGVAAATKWLEGANELCFFNACLQLVRYARNMSSAEGATAALKLLPGKDAYAYHVLRAWDAVVRYVGSSTWLPLPPLVSTSHEYEASHMSEHVQVLYDLIDWSQIKYPENVPLQNISKNDSVREGDRALLCCEMHGVLASQKIIPTQQMVRTLQLSKAEYVQRVDKNRLLTFQNALEDANGPSDAPMKKQSACRKEGKVPNQSWPCAQSFVHSSLTSQNNIATMIKLRRF